jgi:hypothetical protein
MTFYFKNRIVTSTDGRFLWAPRSSGHSSFTQEQFLKTVQESREVF